MNLAIKKSSIPGAGKGLFAIRTKKADLTEAEKRAPVFKGTEQRGDIIAKYTGQVVTPEQLDERYGEYTAPYAFTFQGKLVDAALDRGIASLANRKPHSQANAKLTETGNIRATKNIYDSSEKQPGRAAKGEIFIDYGADYQFEPNVSYSVK
jgi:hypothetical protein